MSFHFFEYFITGKCIIFIFHFHGKSTGTVCPHLQRNVRVSGSDEFIYDVDEVLREAEKVGSSVSLDLNVSAIIENQ